MNGRMLGAALAMFLVVGITGANAQVQSAGTLPQFVPATPGTDIGVGKTKCVNGFAVVYFNRDNEGYPTKKACSEGTGGTAATSRRVKPTNDGQGGKKCPSGTTEYTSCTPVQPLPCCYTNAN